MVENWWDVKDWEITKDQGSGGLFWAFTFDPSKRGVALVSEGRITVLSPCFSFHPSWGTTFDHSPSGKSRNKRSMPPSSVWLEVWLAFSEAILLVSLFSPLEREVSDMPIFFLDFCLSSWGKRTHKRTCMQPQSQLYSLHLFLARQ